MDPATQALLHPLFAQLSSPDTKGIFEIDLTHLLTQVIATVIFTIIGLLFFMFSDWIVERVMPRSVRKAIEEEKNTAVAIVIASVIIGIALIVSAAIRG